MSRWLDHVKKTYAAGKKKSASYKYSQAMKDGAKTFKKVSKAPAKKGRKRKAKKVVEEEDAEEAVGGSIHRNHRVKKKKTMKILKL